MTLFGKVIEAAEGVLRRLSPQAPQASVALESIEAPKSSKPWEDRTLSAIKRYESYDKVVRAHVEGVVAAMTRAGITAEERAAIRLSPDTKLWVSELEQLQSETPKEFCCRIDVPALLGNSFLGAEAWKEGFGVGVGKSPPLPPTITRELLNSDCPLHPGQKIKDTHLLVLVPKTINGEPYSALKLDQLCATRKGSGDNLIYDGEDWATEWKSRPWASAPQVESEWILMAKSDPDPSKVPTDKHFRSKNIAGQQKVHDDRYNGYREVKTVELMTGVLLYDLTHKERLLPDYLRCKEPNASGGRVCVGCFSALGLMVIDDYDVIDFVFIGRALAWR